MSGPRIAVLVPCYNEAIAIGKVIEDFRKALPNAAIYAFDNNSQDDTVGVASRAGAVVRRVYRQGKGNVVRRMFADVEADIYLLVDGDATYDAQSAPALIDKLISENLDMVVGTRVHESSDAYRPGHQFGNRMLTGAMVRIFGAGFTDMLSGYRIFSRRFVKSFPAMSQGFEIETELTIHAMELRMPCGEMATPYGARPEGSESKLRTYSDGVRILVAIIKLFAIERPLRFYSLVATMFAFLTIGLGLPVVLTYFETGLVPRLPTALLSTALGLLAAISFVTGLILETVTVGRRELKQFHYLAAGTGAGVPGNPAPGLGQS